MSKKIVLLYLVAFLGLVVFGIIYFEARETEAREVREIEAKEARETREAEEARQKALKKTKLFKYFKKNANQKGFEEKVAKQLLEIGKKHDSSIKKLLCVDLKRLLSDKIFSEKQVNEERDTLKNHPDKTFDKTTAIEEVIFCINPKDGEGASIGVDKKGDIVSLFD